MLKHLSLAPTSVINSGSAARSPALAAGWRRLVALAGAWLHRGRSRRALDELDDRLLRDIGLPAAEASREAEKPFWLP
jgi:uncharacterized protein YjiS (DUF1127 family)